MRVRGSYQANCHPDGINPPRPTSRRNFMRALMNVVPLGRCPRRVLAAQLLRAPLGAVAGASAPRGTICFAAGGANWLESRIRSSGLDSVFDLNRKVLNLRIGLETFDFEVFCGNLCRYPTILILLVIELRMNYLSRPQSDDSTRDCAGLLRGFA